MDYSVVSGSHLGIPIRYEGTYDEGDGALTVRFKLEGQYMKVRDLDFQYNELAEANHLYSAYTDEGRITVLDRETGFGGGIRDIETGYLDPEGKFWLASGNFDIREYPDLTIPEAVAMVKARANTCNPDRGEEEG